MHLNHTTDACILAIDAEIHNAIENMTELLYKVGDSVSATEPQNVTGPVTFTGKQRYRPVV